MYKSLQEFIHRLKQEGELVEISRFVDPLLEITEITDRISKQPGGGKALLFTNTGSEFPLLINSLGSEKRICLALGIDNLNDVGSRMEILVDKLGGEKKNWYNKLSVLPHLAEVSSYMPAHKSGTGFCQQNVSMDPDLGKLPILKCWPGDGGKFITFPIVHTYHPETRSRNAGMYRMQVFSRNTTGMHWHRHKTGAAHYEAWKTTGQRMPIAVALGGDPVYTFAATAPLPEGIDEYLLAGFLRRKKVEMVRCLTQPIEVPSDVDIVIEGYVDPSEPLVSEGPFGDHTGFYSLRDFYPLFHITCITWRNGAVYPATIVGIPPQEDAWIAKATERIFLQPIRYTLAPEVTDFHLPFMGVAHNLALVSIKKSFPGQAIKVANALWGAGQMMFTKLFVILEEEVDLSDYKAVFERLKMNLRLEHDLFFTKGPVDVLDHSSAYFSFGGKLCIDLTKKLPEEGDTKILEGSEKGVRITTIPSGIGIVDFQVLSEGKISLFLVQLDKTRLSVSRATEIISSTLEGDGQAGFIFIDHSFDKNMTETMLWYVLNNIDPGRDIKVKEKNAVIYITVDGTRKSKKTDNFERTWPNIIVSTEETIQTTDRMWPELGLGELIPSPSRQFRYLVLNDGAEVIE